jgi:hypothetical protein
MHYATCIVFDISEILEEIKIPASIILALRVILILLQVILETNNRRSSMVEQLVPSACDRGS